MDWEATAKAKRDAIFNAIPPEWRLRDPPSRSIQRDVTGAYIHQFLSPAEIEYTESDGVMICSNLVTRKWKCVDVTRAFCHRAALAHQLTNCLLEIFFEKAIARAIELDRYLETHGRPVGMLHGLPVSLKDQFHVEGVETSMGYVGWINTFEGQKGTGKERKFQSEMVKELLASGAVLYCKTSVPHTLMTGETINNIVGYAWNPKNRNLSAGGSSGGEGALIGLRGSPIGFGTDIGGSIRIPAAFNGLYGLRPTTGRLPYEGMANSMDGQNSILSVVGPLATSPMTLQLVIMALLNQQPWLHDPLVVDMPWRPEVQQELLKKTTADSNTKLSFAMFKNDGAVRPHPPVLRALEMVSDALEKLGHEIIEWEASSIAPLAAIAGQVWGLDGGRDVQKDFKLSGEPPAAQVKLLVGDMENIVEAAASQIAALNVQKRKLQKEFMETWNSTAVHTRTGDPVECIICPCAPFSAPQPHGFRHYAYSMFVNVLDYPSITVPVTLVNKNIDNKAEGFKPQSEEDARTQADYDPEIYDGAHVSVQLVGRRFQEEKLLFLADYLRKALST